MVDARDITEAKRTARGEHIDDSGRATDDHIFAHVPKILGVSGWHRLDAHEKNLDFEHFWRRDDKAVAVLMERHRGGWRVKGYGLADDTDALFSFNGRKQAEAFLVEQMLEYEA